MAMTKDASKMRISGYAVTFKGDSLGWMQDVDPSGIKVLKVDKLLPEIGNIVVDKVIIGMDGTIKTVLQQVDIAALRAVIPWAPTSGSIPLVPSTQYQSDYSYAGALVLHPRAVADDSEDITFVKAVPMFPKLPKSSDGKTWNTLEVEWTPFPDQTVLIADTPVLSYGYIGPAPT